jgi:WD40 repeat protein/HEAT repeat protein
VTVWDLGTGTTRLYPITWPQAGLADPRLKHGSFGDLRALAVSPDAKTLALARADGVLGVRDLAGKKPPRAWPTHVKGGATLSFSPDGLVLAMPVSGKEGAILLWDVATGQLWARVEGSTSPHQGMTFSHDGRLLAGGSPGDINTITLWDVRTGTAKATLKGHQQTLYKLVFSPDDRLLASSAFDGTVRLWDLASGQQRAVLKPAGNLAKWLTFSPDGQRLATAAENSATVVLWDVAAGEERGRIQGPTGGHLEALAYAPDGKTLVGSYLDPNAPDRQKQVVLLFWDPVTGQERAQLALLSKGVRYREHHLRFSPNGRTLVVGTENNRVQVLRGATDAEVRAWHDVEAPPPAGAMTNVDPSLLNVNTVRELLRDKDGYVRVLAAESLWEMEKNKEGLAVLAEALRDKEASVRQSAAFFLARVGPPARQAAPALTEALKDADPLVRVAAAEALWAVARDQAAVSALETTLASKDFNTRQLGALALGRMGPAAKPAVPALAAGLADQGSGFRSAAAFVLGQIGPAAADAVPALADALKDKESAFRYAAVAALGKIGPKASGVVAALGLAARKDPRPEVRLEALYALNRMGPDAKGAVPDLAAALKDADQEVRAQVAHVLGQIGPPAAPALAALADNLRAEDARVRGPSLVALQSIDRKVTNRAHRQVQLLYAQGLFPPEVADRLRANKDLDDPARQIALALAAPQPEYAHYLHTSAWKVVLRPGAAAERLRLALYWAHFAHKLHPDSLSLGAVGAAQYRAGEPAAALASLTQAEQLAGKQPGGTSPPLLAFLAMAQQRRGEKQQARATLKRLRTLMKMPAWQPIGDYQALLREAEALIEGK